MVAQDPPRGAAKIATIDEITFLQATRIFAKRLGDGTVDPADRTPRDWYQWGSIPVSDHESLGAALRELASDPTRLIVHERVRDGVVAPLRRGRDAGHLVPTTHRWLVVDVDKMALPDHARAPWEDPHEAAEHVRQSLPYGLDQARMWVQYTASTSATSVSCHVWVWLDAPLTAQKAKVLFGGRYDGSVYDRSHPIYTADPIGADPFSAGARLVELGGAVGHISDPEHEASRQRAMARLDAACAQIARNRGERHPLVNRHAYYLGQLVGQGRLDRAEVYTRLVSAAIRSSHPMPEDRARREIAAALDDGAECPGASDLVTDAKGRPVKIEANVISILRDSALGVAVRSNALTGDIVVSEPYATPERVWEDASDMSAAVQVVEAAYSAPVPRATVWSAVQCIAASQSYDPVRDTLEAVAWDGVPRIDTWLADVTTPGGETPAGYVGHVGRVTLLGMVARQLAPGTKFDVMPILCGPQGIGKTTLWRHLSMGYSVDFRLGDTGDHALSAAVIAVDDELGGLRSARMLETLKSFLTRDTDHYRAPYARSYTTSPRRFVVVGTSDRYDVVPIDPAGARRFLPVPIESVDLDAVESMVPQLWAEARERVAAGLPRDWYVVPGARDAQRRYERRDALVLAIRAALGHMPQTLPEIIETVSMRGQYRDVARRVEDYLLAHPELRIGTDGYGLATPD